MCPPTSGVGTGKRSDDCNPAVNTHFVLFMTQLTLVQGLALAGDAVPSVRVMMPDEPGAITRRAVEILSRQIGQRCGAKVVSSGEAAGLVEVGIEAGIGTEGYRIVDGPGGAVRIVGNDERGLLYGVGRFLRSSRYDRGGFTPGAWRGTSVPRCPMRGIYLATHFNNYYEAASPEELERYVEDLSLWGFNLLMLAYPHWQYAGYNDAGPQDDRASAPDHEGGQAGGDARERRRRPQRRVYLDAPGDALHPRPGSAGPARQLWREPLPQQAGGEGTVAEELGTVAGPVR